MAQAIQQFPGEPATHADVMRHVPPLEWVVRKLGEYQQRAETLHWAAFESGRQADAELLAAAEQELKHLAGSVGRLIEAASRHPKEIRSPEGLRARLEHFFSRALGSVQALDPSRLVLRSHYTEFQRSQGELVFAALLVVGDSIRRLTPLVARINPDVYELLLANLVTLQHPVNEETLRPIA
ncbi:MAG TPA: hypothetical protein VMT00_00010 [Thermoanaerobaculia bacterium]|nr:hypothetical protein [Thermoanaerobaculia bacterium]